MIILDHFDLTGSNETLKYTRSHDKQILPKFFFFENVRLSNIVIFYYPCIKISKSLNYLNKNTTSQSRRHP